MASLQRGGDIFHVTSMVVFIKTSVGGFCCLHPQVQEGRPFHMTGFLSLPCNPMAIHIVDPWVVIISIYQVVAPGLDLHLHVLLFPTKRTGYFFPLPAKNTSGSSTTSSSSAPTLQSNFLVVSQLSQRCKLQ